MGGVVVNSVTKRFGAATALDGVSLTVAEGEFVSLLGPSGCGKTTLLRCIAGLEEPDSGSIRIAGTEVFSPKAAVPPERRNAGMVFQSYAIWPHMTVFENIAYGLRLKKLPEAEIRKRVFDTLALLGLQGYEQRNSFALSGGQQQRVAVARSIVLQPQVLLFDEPLSNLDAKLREQMRVELRALQKSLGTTSIFVTHDQTEAMSISDRVVVMSGGTIIQEGDPASLYFRPQSEFVANFVGITNQLSARLVERSAGLDATGLDARVVTDRGLELRCRVPDTVKIGDPVTLVVRPECVKWSRTDGAAANTWPGTLRESVFVGSLVDATVDVCGHMIRLQAFSADAPYLWAEGGVGAPVFIHIDPGNVILIDRAATKDAAGGSRPGGS
ncbi:MAG: ABC transporter ATP-binding protein [Alphaproteobacteria bacterium]